MAAVAVALIGPLTIAAIVSAYPAYVISAVVGLSLLVGVAIYKPRKDEVKTGQVSTIKDAPKGVCTTKIEKKWLDSLLETCFCQSSNTLADEDNDLWVRSFTAGDKIYEYQEFWREWKGWVVYPSNNQNTQCGTPINDINKVLDALKNAQHISLGDDFDDAEMRKPVGASGLTAAFPRSHVIGFTRLGSYKNVTLDLSDITEKLNQATS